MPIPDLRQRNLQPELMDDPELEQGEHQRALAGLKRIHHFTGIEGRFWRVIKRKINSRKLKSFTVLDIGCGDATLLRRISKRSQSAGYQSKIIGCDFSEQALAMAQVAAATENIPLETLQCDITKDNIPLQADIVICSLFLHHFSNDEIPRILEKLAESAKSMLLIEDLIRSSLGYMLCQIGVHLLSRSPIVHFDGPRSVEGALTTEEIKELLLKANLSDATITKHWPERFLLTLDK